MYNPALKTNLVTKKYTNRKGYIQEFIVYVLVNYKQ